MAKKKRRAARACLCALAWTSLGGLVLSAPAKGAALLESDGVSLTAGYGGNVDVIGVALHWRLPWLGADAVGQGFSARLVAQLDQWRGNGHPDQAGASPNRFIWDTSLTPMLRWTDRSAPLPGFYAEAGVGLHLLSSTRINDDRIFSTAFQFGEQGGIGVSFGAEDQYELGVYVQHVSNANIKKPNDGLTYSGVVFRAAFP